MSVAYLLAHTTDYNHNTHTPLDESRWFVSNSWVSCPMLL